jgi:hypothetical protein
MLKEAVEPLFAEFQTVIQDYQQMFTALRLAVETNNEEVNRQSIDTFRKDRRQFDAARQKIAIVSRRYTQGLEHEKAREMAHEISLVFDRVAHAMPEYSASTTLEVFCRRYLTASLIPGPHAEQARGELLNHVCAIDELITKKWRTVSELYAELRVLCISP